MTMQNVWVPSTATWFLERAYSLQSPAQRNTRGPEKHWRCLHFPLPGVLVGLKLLNMNRLQQVMIKGCRRVAGKQLVRSLSTTRNPPAVDFHCAS